MLRLITESRYELRLPVYIEDYVNGLLTLGESTMAQGAARVYQQQSRIALRQRCCWLGRLRWQHGPGQMRRCKL